MPGIKDQWLLRSLPKDIGKVGVKLNCRGFGSRNRTIVHSIDSRALFPLHHRTPNKDYFSMYVNQHVCIHRATETPCCLSCLSCSWYVMYVLLCDCDTATAEALCSLNSLTHMWQMSHLFGKLTSQERIGRWTVAVIRERSSRTCCRRTVSAEPRRTLLLDWQVMLYRK